MFKTPYWKDRRRKEYEARKADFYDRLDRVDGCKEKPVLKLEWKKGGSYRLTVLMCARTKYGERWELSRDVKPQVAWWVQRWYNKGLLKSNRCTQYVRDIIEEFIPETTTVKTYTEQCWGQGCYNNFNYRTFNSIIVDDSWMEKVEEELERRNRNNKG